jgi:hypothetical protein
MNDYNRRSTDETHPRTSRIESTITARRWGFRR